MKQTITSLILLALLSLLLGCTEQGTAQDDQQEENNTEKVKEVEIPEEPVEKTSEVIKEEKVEQEPAYQLEENWTLKPINETDNEKVVLLTIDDAPDQHALEMAETLKELDAEAIFFVNGHFLDTEEEKQILKQIYEMGFEIGNHTYNHQALPEVDQATQKEEILALSDLVEEITGERPKFFRAPHGMNTDFSKQLVKQENMLLMNWSYGYDWEKQYMTKEAIADIMVNTNLLGNGSNLLMHDRKWTAEGLEDIIVGLREKGFEILDPELIEVPGK